MKMRCFHLFLFLVIISNHAIASEIAVISNLSFPQNDISIEQLKDIYSGDLKILSSTKIKPYDHKDPVINGKFIEKIIGSSVTAYKKYWLKRIFQHDGQPPTVKQTTEDIISSIAEHKGGIGYVWKKDAEGISGIKILMTKEVGD